MRLWQVFRIWLQSLRSTEKLPLGQRGEAAAARYLQKKGYRILDRGVSGRLGEIDLVAVERRGARRLIFVEVKTRTAVTEDHPADRVDFEKQKRLTRAALTYLKRKRLLEHPCRFDVIAVWWSSTADQPERFEHYEDAFAATGRESMFT